jgi:hypothetical protein
MALAWAWISVFFAPSSSRVESSAVCFPLSVGLGSSWCEEDEEETKCRDGQTWQPEMTNPQLPRGREAREPPFIISASRFHELSLTFHNLHGKYGQVYNYSCEKENYNMTNM